MKCFLKYALFAGVFIAVGTLFLRRSSPELFSSIIQQTKAAGEGSKVSGDVREVVRGSKGSQWHLEKTEGVRKGLVKKLKSKQPGLKSKQSGLKKNSSELRGLNEKLNAVNERIKSLPSKRVGERKEGVGGGGMGGSVGGENKKWWEPRVVEDKSEEKRSFRLNSDQRGVGILKGSKQQPGVPLGGNGMPLGGKKQPGVPLGGDGMPDVGILKGSKQQPLGGDGMPVGGMPLGGDVGILKRSKQQPGLPLGDDVGILKESKQFHGGDVLSGAVYELGADGNAVYEFGADGKEEAVSLQQVERDNRETLMNMRVSLCGIPS